MRTRSQHPIMAAVLLIALTVGATVVSQAADEARENDESAVRAASEEYVNALSRGDAKAVAAMWTENGIYVDAAGEEFNARQLAEQEFSASTDEDRPVRDTATISSTIRFIDGDVALEEGVATRSKLETNDAGGVRFSALWVHEDGRWQLDHLRETPIPSSNTASPLQALSWFIGDWTATGDDLNASLSVRWSDDGKFLMQHFTVRRTGQDELRSVQRIGWDPASKIIRSWAFHSNGGFVEGEWKHEGDTWAVATVGVLPDGQRSTSTNLWVPEGENTLWFKLHRGTVSGEDVDDLMVEFIRNDESP